MGKSAKATFYKFNMAIHAGICHGPVDEVKAIYAGEKLAWKGRAKGNTSLDINKEGLFGGIQKEGGVSGVAELMFGADDQLATEALAERVGGTPSTVPGFRGILSILFRGREPEKVLENIPPRGFYWAATNPYIKPVWVTVQRIPRQLDKNTAAIYRSGGENARFYFQLDNTNPSQINKVKAAMHIVLDYMADAVSQGQQIGIGVSAFTGENLEYSSLSRPRITSLRNWVDNLAAYGSANYDTAIAPAVSWFNASADDARVSDRVNVFLSASPPSPVDSAAEAANRAATLISRVVNVDMYAINVGMTDISYTGLLDNTAADGVPVIDGDASALTGAVMNSLKGAADANPAHVIYECLTDTDWGMGADPAMIDVEAFKYAARVLFEERFGVFFTWRASSTIESFINSVLEHISGAIFTDPSTGKISIRLLRDDYDRDNLRVLSPDNATLQSFSRKSWGETSNEVVVTWTNPASEKEETVRSQDLGNIAIQGAVVSDTRNYHGVRNSGLAQRLAERELRSSSASLCSCEASVDRSFWDVTPMEVVRVDWPEYGLDGMAMRVTKVDYGTTGSSTIKLSLVEDVFALPQAAFVSPQQSESLPVSAAPAPVSDAELLMVPAYAVSRSGESLSDVDYPVAVAAVLAASPVNVSNASFNMQLKEYDSLGNVVWSDVGSVNDFVPRSEIPGGLEAEATSTFPTPFPGYAAGGILVIGGELALVTANGENMIVNRGVLDTVPVAHAPGQPIWYLSMDDLPVVPAALTEGQSVDVRLFTNTAEGQTPYEAATILTGVAMSRAGRPLRPANVKVNGVGFGVADATDGVVEVTWSHRNRLLEDSVVYAWDASSVSPEPGVTYNVRLEVYDGALLEVIELDAGASDTLTYSGPWPAGASYVDVTVEAVKDVESWQAFTLRARLIAEEAPRSTEAGETRLTETGDTRVVE